MSGIGKETTTKKLPQKETEELSVEVSKTKPPASSKHNDSTDEKVEAINLTKDKLKHGACKDKKKKVIEENISKSNKDEKSSETKLKKNDESKNQKEEAVEKIKKDSSINKKVRPKTASKSVDTTKKKKGITKKKVRGVQDQEIPEKKQTSLTDHFQVRRSERKLKTLCDIEAQMAIQKQIISGIEDGLEIKVLEDKGRGIFTSRDFKNGHIVCEYAGELIDIKEARERESKYEETPEVGSYMYFFQYNNQKYCVDATKETNRLGRLVNHSKTSSNVYTKIFPIKDVPHLILVASRDIECGEELLYDYGDRSKKSLDSHPWLKC